MLRSDWDKKICAQYSARDEKGYVHCSECPLRLPQVHETACKATHHWNGKEWVEDDTVLRTDNAE